MFAFILRRLLLMVPTTLGVALVIFSLYHAAPGDPATVMMGSAASGDIGGDADTESRIDKFRREHGLDRNFFVQFFDYVGPFNLNADGHPWFSSPRTERETEEIEVTDPETGEVRTVREGQPREIEHLYETTPEEREALDGFVATMLDDDAGEDAWAEARERLTSAPWDTAAGRRKALAPVMDALHTFRLPTLEEEPRVERLHATLAAMTGASPELDPVLEERDGLRHVTKRWFAWYYDNGGYRVTNTGQRKWDGLLALDLGKEMQSNQPVLEELWLRLQVTVPLSLASIVLSYLIALPLGIFSVRRQGTRIDGAMTVLLFVLYSIPTFWAGLMLILLLGGTGLDWFPVLGLHDKDAQSFGPWRYAWDVVVHSVLPIVTLTYGSLAYLSRQMRAGMLEVIRQDYIRTARAKGLSDDRVVYKHALRNSMIPVLTLLASILPILIGGSIIVEAVFDIPGMGQYAYQGLLRRDFNIVMATTLFVGVMTQLGILLSDITYSLVDPRIRLD